MRNVGIIHSFFGIQILTEYLLRRGCSEIPNIGNIILPLQNNLGGKICERCLAQKIFCNLVRQIIVISNSLLVNICQALNLNSEVNVSSGRL